MPEQYDLIVIGAGVIGAMVARFLSRYNIRILIIEQEADVCTCTSSANSGIIHAGYDPVPGTLKAEMNVKGNAMWSQLAAELGFPFKQHGTHVVAIGEAKLATLDELLVRGKANGILGLRIISGEEMRRREPSINPQVSGALFAETGGICDPWATSVAAIENALANGVMLKLSTSFKDFVLSGNRIIGIETNRGTFSCRWAVNAAGLFSDEVMHKLGVRPEFRITPRRGEYYVLDRSRFIMNNTLWPVPSETSKGIGVTTTVHGNVLVGANAQIGKSKTDRTVTSDGLREVWQRSSELVPGLDSQHTIAAFAGLRATGNASCKNSAVKYYNDFVIEIPENVGGFINLAGIDSPGLTAAPAIALRVIEMLDDAGEELHERPGWNPVNNQPQFDSDFQPQWTAAWNQPHMILPWKFK
jgi:glycerol-3-phosphate dehydrogenase